jgi:hypothetical protein
VQLPSELGVVSTSREERRLSLVVVVALLAHAREACELRYFQPNAAGGTSDS